MGIDCLRLNRLARMAGAPVDKGAGITVFKKIGERVEAGEPLYRIYACESSEFELVSAAAKANNGFDVDGEAAMMPGTQ
jgi:thymidine phosphorylase